MQDEHFDIVVVGGGFFGLYIALHCAQRYGKRVCVLESESELMIRASYNNQARVHNGYHYPRSVLTALRSSKTFPRFSDEFDGAIIKDFKKYYAIGKLLGKVTDRQFRNFCNTIGIPCNEVSSDEKALFDGRYVSNVFQTVEYAFDASQLRDIMKRRLDATGLVEVRCRCEVESLEKEDGSERIRVGIASGDASLTARHVFNCTYSRLNQLTTASGTSILPLKHEMTEMCLVRSNHELLNKIAVTVMCGPFFSYMPFPARDCYTLSHVRYTPHYEWFDSEEKGYIDTKKIYDVDSRQSNWKSMIKDVCRYMPLLEELEYLDSLWEVKTLLPRSEVDDSRPILFKEDYGMRGFHCVLGGKIDNAYDVVDKIDEKLGACL